MSRLICLVVGHQWAQAFHDARYGTVVLRCGRCDEGKVVGA